MGLTYVSDNIGKGFDTGLLDDCNYWGNCSDCAGEGEYPEGNISCCPGLRQRQNYVYDEEAGECIFMDSIGGPCRNLSECGDGYCSQGSEYPSYEGNEDICNCPEDCAECVGEGESYNHVDTHNLSCCPGLTGIVADEVPLEVAGEEFRDDANERGCVNIGSFHSSATLTCMDCGNGECEEPENRCNCPEDCSNENETCAEEGEYINPSPGFNPDYPDECCEGLTPTGAYDPETCEQLIGTPYAKCIACGDGICENSTTENKCNCPEDCGGCREDSDCPGTNEICVDNECVSLGIPEYPEDSEPTAPSDSSNLYLLMGLLGGLFVGLAAYTIKKRK